jgi:hypothetical protein
MPMKDLQPCRSVGRLANLVGELDAANRKSARTVRSAGSGNGARWATRALAAERAKPHARPYLNHRATPRLYRFSSLLFAHNEMAIDLFSATFCTRSKYVCLRAPNDTCFGADEAN